MCWQTVTWIFPERLDWFCGRSLVDFFVNRNGANERNSHAHSSYGRNPSKVLNFTPLQTSTFFLNGKHTVFSYRNAPWNDFLIFVYSEHYQRTTSVAMCILERDLPDATMIRKSFSCYSLTSIIVWWLPMEPEGSCLKEDWIPSLIIILICWRRDELERTKNGRE